MTADSAQSVSAQDYLAALAPIVRALGGDLVADESRQPGDIPVRWEGVTIAHVRTADLHGALRRLIASVEREIGCSLANMSREQKQRAVRRLDEQGAFLLRGAVDDIAAVMGVSRVTLYSYLNAIRPS